MSAWWERSALTAEAVAGWLAGVLAEVPAEVTAPVPVLHSASPPDMPHRVVWVHRAGGPGLLFEEGVYDALTFTFWCRGAGSAPSVSETGDAEQIANLVDAALLGAYSPTIGGVLTLGWDRAGDGPSPDPDAGNRPVLSCNYTISAATV